MTRFYFNLSRGKEENVRVYRRTEKETNRLGDDIWFKYKLTKSTMDICKIYLLFIYKIESYVKMVMYNNYSSI